MNRKLLEKTGIFSVALLLCLCVSLLCPAAFEEAPVDLMNTEGEDYIFDFCTLPDGGLVFAGSPGGIRRRKRAGQYPGQAHMPESRPDGTLGL